MSQRKITRRRLEFLLENWGNWEADTRLGPAASKRCASAEREFASDSSRFVWDAGSTVPRETADDPALAEKTEAVLIALDRPLQRVLVLRYARRLTPERMAAAMRMSRVSVEALLDTAVVAIWTELEDRAWAHGL